MTLQAETRTAIERARDRYPLARSAILPALWAVQHEQGQITAGAMTEVAGILQVTPSEVEAVSTFYSMYFQHPHGRHEVIVCINVSCALRGADEIVDHLERTLGCASGETTADGAFTWASTVECLGGCGGAPMMQVDHHFEENLTPGRVDAILGALRSAPRVGEAGPVAAGSPRRGASRAPALPPAAPSASATGPVSETSPAQGSAGQTPLTTPKEPEQSAITGPGIKKRPQRRGKAAQ
jgi:NADH-quinone oxidoreductase subunit E